MNRPILAALCGLTLLACASAPPARTPGGPEDPNAPSAPIAAPSTTLAAPLPAESAPAAQTRPFAKPMDAGMPMNMPGMEMGSPDAGMQRPQQQDGSQHHHHHPMAAPDAGDAMPMDMPGMQMNGGSR